MTGQSKIESSPFADAYANVGSFQRGDYHFYISRNRVEAGNYNTYDDNSSDRKSESGSSGHSTSWASENTDDFKEQSAFYADDEKVSEHKSNVKDRADNLVEKIEADDVFVKLFEDTLKYAPQISYLQPGSEIMAYCPIKAEFWSLRVDGEGKEEIEKTIDGYLATAPKHTVGITIPFRFKSQDVNADTASSFGIMNLERKKMNWKTSAGTSNLVCEISMFKTTDEDRHKKVTFLNDFGQFNRISGKNFKKMTEEDVTAFFNHHGFESKKLREMIKTGKQLLHVFNPFKVEDFSALSVVFDMPESEARRLCFCVESVMRRASKDRKIPKEGKTEKVAHNAYEIEILPFIKPVQIKCGTPFSLETELRATAVAFDRAMSGDNSKVELELKSEGRQMWTEQADEDEQSSKGKSSTTSKRPSFVGAPDMWQESDNRPVDVAGY